MRISLAACVTMSLCVSGSLLAQAACVPSKPTAPDTASVIVFASWGGDVDPDSASRDAYILHAQAVKENFHAPKVVALPQDSTWTPGDDSRAPGARAIVADLTAALDLGLTPAGRLTSVRLLNPTPATELNEALVAAAYRADSAEAFVGLPRPRTADSTELELVIGGAVQLLPGETPLMKVRVPFVRNAVPPTLISQPVATFPRELFGKALPTTVGLKFMLGADGRAIDSTVVAFTPSQPEFVREAKRAIRGSRYTPAMRDGCPTPFAMTQAIVIPEPRVTTIRTDSIAVVGPGQISPNRLPR